jgi:hypothetical protein
MTSTSDHNVQRYWRGCRCSICKAAHAQYMRVYRFHLKSDRLVPSSRARQLLLTFEDAADAARVLKMSRTTLWTIRSGRVKFVRQSTESKVLKAAA